MIGKYTEQLTCGHGKTMQFSSGTDDHRSTEVGLLSSQSFLSTPCMSEKMTITSQVMLEWAHQVRSAQHPSLLSRARWALPFPTDRGLSSLCREFYNQMQPFPRYRVKARSSWQLVAT